MENESILFLYSALFDSVRGRAGQFSGPRIGLKIRRPLRSWGFDPPSRHQETSDLAFVVGAYSLVVGIECAHTV